MTLTKRIIPCLDVTAGRVVKGVNFVDLQDIGNPVEIAKAYSDAGADELVFLDITATVEERKTMVDVVRETAAEVFIPLTVGGGIQSVADMQELLRAGADKVSLNSAALKRPALIQEGALKFGNQCIVVAIDAKKTGENKWEIFTHGGRKPTGIDAIEWAVKMADFGAGELLVTSMDADGTKAGYDIALMRQINDRVNIPTIASGGVGNLQHLADGILKGGADAVLAASIFHFGQHTIPEAKQYLAEQGIEMRL